MELVKVGDNIIDIDKLTHAEFVPACDPTASVHFDDMVNLHFGTAILSLEGDEARFVWTYLKDKTKMIL